MNRTLLSNVIRVALFVIGIIALVETYGFFVLQDWAKAIIPWELNRMAGIFLSSICAASALPMLWIALSKQYAAITGGALNFTIMFAGFAGFSFLVYAANSKQPVLIFALICLVSALIIFGIIFFGLHHSFDDSRRVPGIVRISFLTFSINLLIAGGLMAFKEPNIFPWQVTIQQSVLYGWIFLGASGYFLYGFLRPVWSNAYGQLIGFLAYDLVLIFPFIALFFSNEPFLVPNMLYYIIVLIYSGGLAIYYLFINKPTRISFNSSHD